MEQKLKSLLRRSRSGKDSSHAPPRSAPAPNPQTPRAAHQTTELTPPSSGPRISDQAASSWSNQSMSNSNPSEESPRSSASSPLTGRRTSNASFSVPARKPLPIRKDTAYQIADDHVAYLPAVEQDMQYMTLGGDTRLIDTPSAQHHSEDVADRNIQKFGGDRTSSSYSSIGQRYPHSVGKDMLEGSLYSPSGRNGITTTQSHSTNAARAPRDEGSVQGRGRLSDDQTMDFKASRANDQGQQNPLTTTDSHTAASRSREVKEHGIVGATDGYAEPPSLDGIVDLTDTVDVDKSTNWAPAVTHEVVKPTEHHIREERIYREIHNHDVYHYVQPVHQIEVLPTRHFMPNPANPSDHTDLVEISEASLPPGTTFHQRWIVAAAPEDPNAPRSKFFSSSEPRRTEPVILEDKTYMTPEGFERRETTILHPPTLEDMSGYGGPVLPIHFAEGGTVQEGPVRMLSGETRKVEEALVDPLAVDPKTVTESMQERRRGEGSAIPQQFVPDRTSSKRHRWSRTVDEMEMHGGDSGGGGAVQLQQQQQQTQPHLEEHKDVKRHVEREQHRGNQHVMGETKKMPSMLDV